MTFGSTDPVSQVRFVVLSECGDGAVALAAGFPRQHQGRCNNEDKDDGGADDVATVTMEATVSDDEHGDISNDHNANHCC